MTTLSGDSRTLVPGRAEGRVLVLEEPLSFWGGLDPHTGLVIDGHHPQAGRAMSGCVLIMASGRGSSSSSSVLAEALRVGTGPAAILMRGPDTIVAVGALVAAELYETACPVAVLDPAAFAAAASAEVLSVEAGPGGVSIRELPSPGRQDGDPSAGRT